MQLNISVREENRGQIESIQRACSKYKVNLSQMAVDAIIEAFETGKWAKLIKK